MKKLCLIETCSSNKLGVRRLTRGLCKKCYQTASSLVRRKKTTWKALEDAGLVLKRTAQRDNISAFTLAYHKLIKEPKNAD